MGQGQDRDDNPFKLSPRYRNKVPVIRQSKADCTHLFSEYGICLSQYDFDPSKCAEQLKNIEECRKETRITRRSSPFNYHLNMIMRNKYRIPIP